MRVDVPVPPLRVNAHGRLVREQVPQFGADGRMLPPQDVQGGVFCATCAAVPADERCPKCPRGRRSFAAFAVADEEHEPRRRWWQKTRNR